MVFAKVGDSTTYVVGNYSGSPFGTLGLGNPGLRGDHQVAIFYNPPPADLAGMRTLNRYSGEEHTILMQEPAFSSRGMAMTDDYVLLTVGGTLLRVARATGEKKAIGSKSDCFFPQIVAGKYTCTSDAGSRYYQWNIETPGEPIELAPTAPKIVQEGGRCTSDGSHCGWIDYRDAPGPKSTYDVREGGEVYVKEMASGVVERLTFDSPSAPRLKGIAAANAEMAVWEEVPGVPQGPVSADALSDADVLTKLDRKTQQRCRYTFRSGSYHLLGRKLLAVWAGSNSQGYSYVVEVDLDSPDIPWVCEQNAVPQPPTP